MSSPRFPAAELPAYNVFAMENYTMLVYDGGEEDHMVYINSHIRLFKLFPAEQAIGFVAHVERIVEYQTDFVVLAITPRNVPDSHVLLAVRYRKLGGLLGYVAPIVAALLSITGHLHPNSTRTTPIPDVLPPLSSALQARWYPRIPATMPTLWVGVPYVPRLCSITACSRYP